MNQPSLPRDRRGFSLIELLVVISIVAILVGIMLPALAVVRAKATQTACASNLHQIGLALEMYAGDFKDMFPYAQYNGPGIADPGTPPKPTFPEAMDHYLPYRDPQTARVYECPGDSVVFPVTTMSYYYSSWVLAGETLSEIEDRWFVRRMNWNASRIRVMTDFDGNEIALDNGETLEPGFFHRERNHLFADGRVGGLRSP